MLNAFLLAAQKTSPDALTLGEMYSALAKKRLVTPPKMAEWRSQEDER